MIASNRELVENIKSNIISSSSEVQMGANVEASDTDLEVHQNCVKSYDESNKSLVELKSIMEKNANIIGDIAANFDLVDEQLANNLRA